MARCDQVRVNNRDESPWAADPALEAARGLIASVMRPVLDGVGPDCSDERPGCRGE